jgi:hypothetical protein
MNSTIPADILKLKARFETWRANRKYLREPIPDELWTAAADFSRRYPPSFVSRVLKLDPSRLKKLLIKRSSRTSVRKSLRPLSSGYRPTFLLLFARPASQARVFFAAYVLSSF